MTFDLDIYAWRFLDPIEVKLVGQGHMSKFKIIGE